MTPRANAREHGAARTTRAAAAVVLAVAAALTLAACGAGSGGAGASGAGRSAVTAGVVAGTPSTTAPETSAALPPQARAIDPDVRLAAATPTDPWRIGAADWLAIEALGRSTAGTPRSTHDHGHGGGEVHLELPMFNGDAVTFADQWLTARRSTVDVDSIDEAKALGYVRAASPGAGIGTHWVLWPQIAKPFDPARPAMLLFDERKRPAVLVGYSYWLQSAVEPVGFAGNGDEWHQHTGLCVVNGWVDREEAASADRCAGIYLAGGDLWMLHAWAVPAFPNRHGRFATFNPTLCPSRFGTPDISRCPD